MNVYILAPANRTSGGPELAHQMCHRINELSPGTAFMVYVDLNLPIGEDLGADVPAPEAYAIYNTEHISDYAAADKEGNIFVFPEGLTLALPFIKKATKVLWWMSVDNYTESTGEENLDSIIERSEYHLVQSEYARNYIYNKNVSQDKILWLTDYIRRDMPMWRAVE